MKKQIFIAGAPSFYGGADVELAHLILLLRKKEVSVNIVPMHSFDKNARSFFLNIGCEIHEYKSNIFKDKVVVSFCNGNFLKELPKINKDGRPSMTVWANCMTYTFGDELSSVKDGLIDVHLFQSKYQKELLIPQLSAFGKVQIGEGYRAYFDPDDPFSNIKFVKNKQNEIFVYGRISRDDPYKFPQDLWRTYYKVCSPNKKHAVVVGLGPKSNSKVGKPFKSFSHSIYSPGGLSQSTFYDWIHCLVHKTGGSRENWPRVVIESLAAGVVPIVENDYAMSEMIEDGVHGYLCNSSDEMSYRASCMAFDSETRLKIAKEGRNHLVGSLASESNCWSFWNKIL